MEHPAYARPQRVKGVLDIAWSTVSAFSISHRRRVVFVFVRVAFSFDLPRAMLRDTHDRAVEKQVVRNQTRKMNFSKIVDSEPRHRRMRHVRLEIRCTAHRTKWPNMGIVYVYVTGYARWIPSVRLLRREPLLRYSGREILLNIWREWHLENKMVLRIWLPCCNVAQIYPNLFLWRSENFRVNFAEKLFDLFQRTMLKQLVAASRKQDELGTPRRVKRQRRWLVARTRWKFFCVYEKQREPNPRRMIL